MLPLIFIILAALLSNAYFAALNVASPGTFLGMFSSFSAVWFWISVFFALLFVLEKHGILKKILRKIPKKAKIAAFSLACIFIAVSGASLFFICHPNLAKGNENARYLIVLGGGITKDAKLTASVKERVFAASLYLNKNPSVLAIVSGGKGNFSPCAEADALKSELVSLGIAEERILEEDRSKDTIQNLAFSAAIIAEREGAPIDEAISAPVAICTSGFHLARAERIAAKLGFKKVYGVASRTPPLFVPNTYCREICSYIKLNLRILLTGKPKAL